MSQAIYIYVKVASHLFEATPETIVDSTNSHKSYFQVFYFKFIRMKAILNLYMQTYNICVVLRVNGHCETNSSFIFHGQFACGIKCLSFQFKFVIMI